MVFAVFFPIRVTQKHPAQSPRNVLRRKGGRSSPQPFSQNAHCNHGTYRARALIIDLKSASTAKVRLTIGLYRGRVRRAFRLYYRYTIYGLKNAVKTYGDWP